MNGNKNEDDNDDDGAANNGSGDSQGNYTEASNDVTLQPKYRR